MSFQPSQFLLTLGCMLGLILTLSARGEAVADASASSPAETLTYRVGVFDDNFPFSSKGQSGEVEGFAVDLLAAVERVMSLRLERVVGNTGSITSDFHAGRVEMLQSFAHTPARESEAEFSVPYLIMAGSIFARHDGPSFENLAALRGHRVMVHRGSLGERLLREAGLEETIVYVESVDEALRRLSAGEADATLVSRLTGLASAARHGWENIGPTGEPIPGYNVRYCFAVREGNRTLLAHINEGLAILQRNGEFERIYRHWFGRIDPAPGYTAADITTAIAAGLAVALLIAIWAVARQRALGRRIAAQAQAIRVNEERYRGFFEASQEGFVVVAPAGGDDTRFVIEQVNSVARRLLPFSSPDVTGRPLHHAMTGGVEFCQRIATALSSKEEPIFEYQPAPDRYLRVSAARIGPRILVVASDLTAAKQAEERLRLRDQQLRQTQKLEALGTLASGIAHDFNNVLTTILGNADIATFDLPPDSSVQGQLDEIRAASERARQLVRQILTYSRQTESRREIVPLSPVIEESLRFLRATVPTTIRIRHRSCPAATLVEADTTQLHQVLMNLLTNAVHAIGDGHGTVEIAEEIVALTPALSLKHPELEPGDYVRISIRDTGCGMPPEVMQRIFEPFFTTKDSGRGTGLGLSVVHGILQNHHGAISVSSTPGEGSTFFLFFPLAQRPAPARENTAPVGAISGGGERVLLLDDEQAIVRAASVLLTRLGYAVSAHHDPTAALAEFEKAPDSFAVAITDLTMPRMTGFELAGHLRQHRPSLPVILMSGYITDKDHLRIRELGIARVLDKPVTLAALGHAVAETLAGRN